MERKSEWFCGVNFFRSNFKVEWENGVWTKIRFLGSGCLFTCGNFTLIFTVFFRFFGSNFFLDGFPNPFTAHSRPSFLFELNFHFSLVVFLFTCGILTLIFCFFLFFDLIFLKWFSQFTLTQGDKAKWMCVTIIEAYLRAADRGNKNFYRFLIKI